MKDMRVAMYYSNEDIRIERMPVPGINDDELLLRVLSSGICGSDVMSWYREKSAPRVLGHEVTGEVVEVGGGVKKFIKGDRVVVTHHVPCNSCYYCLREDHTLCDTLRTTNFDPGGFSEFIRVPAINVDRGVFKLPDSMTDDDGTFVEPLGCVIRGLKVARFRPGESVLVIGSGISGLLHINLLRMLGAGKITAVDINSVRLDAAKKFGADNVLNAGKNMPDGLSDANGGRMPDLVVVCTGAPQAIVQSVKCAGRGGRILFFGVAEPGVEIPLPVFDLWKDGISIVNTYGAAPVDLSEAIELISTGRHDFREMVTHRLPLSETAEGFKLVSGAHDSVKVVIVPGK